MNNWTKSEFGDLFDTIYRYPTYYGIKYVDKGVKEVRGELLSSNGNIDDNCRYISDTTASRFPKVRLKEDDIVISVRGTLGKIGFVDSLYVDAVITANLLRLSPNKNKVDTRWLLQTMIGENFRTQLEFSSSQTTIKTIQIPQLARIVIYLPSPREQKKIASILTTVDNLIEKTEALIHKYQQIKAGLMHDLFTRGLTADGRLRPPREQAPELYQETSIGWLPKEWDVNAIDRLATFHNGNTFDAHAWKESGLPIIRIQNLNGSHEFNYYEGPVSPNWHVAPGTLLFAWSGTRETSFGPHIWSGPEGVLNQHIFKVIPNSELVAQQYFLFLMLKWRLDAITKSAHGFKDSFVHVTRNELTSVPCALPMKNEQAMISSRMSAIDANIKANMRGLDKLKQQKSGLMNDLLTGKVPVFIDPTETAHNS